MKNSALAMVIAVMVVFSFGSKLYSQISIDDITSSESVKINKKAVENLKAAISSDNLGVRRSAIFHAGFYRVNDALGTLIGQLRLEKDPSTRILIALSLYKLGDEGALRLVKEYSKKDSDLRVRRMCTAIYDEYLISKDKVAGR